MKNIHVYSRLHRLVPEVVCIPLRAEYGKPAPTFMKTLCLLMEQMLRYTSGIVVYDECCTSILSLIIEEFQFYLTF